MSEPVVPTPLFANVADRSLTALLNLLDALAADVRTIDSYQKNDPTGQPLRRAFVRSCWGYFEGSTHSLARFVETIEVLTDSKHDKRPKEKERTLDEFKITLKWCTSDRLTRGWSPDFGGPGWKAVRNSYKVRTRLMHPKTAESFDVSDNDLKLATDALAWFIQTIGEVLVRAQRAAQ